MKSMYMMAMMAAMLEGGMQPDGRTSIHRPAPQPKPKKDIKPKGLQMFNIDGIEVWAINEKNARRKAAKLSGVTHNGKALAAGCASCTSAQRLPEVRKTIK